MGTLAIEADDDVDDDESVVDDDIVIEDDIGWVVTDDGFFAASVGRIFVDTGDGFIVGNVVGVDGTVAVIFSTDVFTALFVGDALEMFWGVEIEFDERHPPVKTHVMRIIIRTGTISTNVFLIVGLQETIESLLTTNNMPFWF